MSFKALKRKACLFLERYRVIWSLAYKINLILFHWDNRQHAKKFGKLNPEKNFYVIRGQGTYIGLLSYYLNGLDAVCRCKRKNLIPIVDFMNYKTQYNADFPIEGTYNAWEYYFEQPCAYSLEEVYKSRNVILSGWKFFQRREDEINSEEMYEAMQNTPIKKYIRDIADEKIKSEGINDMLGVLVRGTDYVKLKPQGHAISPTPEQVCEKLDEFLGRYGNSRIFLATEDAEVYNFFTKRYGKMIYSSDGDKNLLKNYSGKDYLENEIISKNKYKFGLDYLVKMICLSECKCLIASRTAGSSFARLLNHGRYLEDYLFDLGVY